MDTEMQDARHPFRGVRIEARSYAEALAIGWRLDPIIVASAFIAFTEGDSARATGLLVANVGATQVEARAAVRQALAELPG
jgi:hypothetical protein